METIALQKINEVSDEMPCIGTVRIMSTSELRLVNVHEPENVYLEDSFELTVEGSTREYAFLDARGRKAPIAIEGMKSFNLNNQNEVTNFNNLQIYFAAYGDRLGKKVVFYDPRKEATQLGQKADLTLTVHDMLRENREDGTWLTKVFRRVEGLATAGITKQMAFNRLFETAFQNPEKFFINDKAVWADEDFEYKALLDAALERGQLARDGNFIKYPDGKPLAKDYEEAVFYLRNDRQLREYLNRSSDAPQRIPVPEAKGVQLPEALAQLARESGTPLEKDKINEDGTVDTETDPEKQMEDTIKALAKEKLIETNSHHGAAARYRLSESESDVFLKLSEIIGYFKLNTSEYERYKSMLG